MRKRPTLSSDRDDDRFVTTAGFVHDTLKQSPPKLAFDPDMSRQQFGEWQGKVRTKLRQLMCFPDVRDRPPPRQLWTKDRDGYELQKWEAYPEPRSVVPFLMLVPEDIEHPAPAVMCFPGSTSTKERLAGEPETSDHPHWERNRMALHYARRGIVAVAMDNPGIGELSDPVVPSRHELVVNLLWIGRNYEGLSVFQKLPVLDWLRIRDFVDSDRIAVSGHSLGAKPALIMAVLRPSIAALVWNDFVCDFRERAIALNLGRIAIHQYVPGLLNWFDYPDLKAAVAPRPLLITEGGRTPHIDKLSQAWNLLEAPDNVTVHYYPRFADPDDRLHEGERMPEGVSMRGYLRRANVDVPDHAFKRKVAVPWLADVLNADS